MGIGDIFAILPQQIVFGLALSVASTVVLLRAMQARRLMETERGRIAVGWLIVEDIAMVLTLVMLPPLAGLLKDEGDVEWSALALPLAFTLGKIAAFVALMLLVGRRVIPRVLHYVAHTGSRELFRLAVFAIALGVAYGSAVLFDVSFALGSGSDPGPASSVGTDGPAAPGARRAAARARLSAQGCPTRPTGLPAPRRIVPHSGED